MKYDSVKIVVDLYDVVSCLSHSSVPSEILVFENVMRRQEHREQLNELVII